MKNKNYIVSFILGFFVAALLFTISVNRDKGKQQEKHTIVEDSLKIKAFLANNWLLSIDDWSNVSIGKRQTYILASIKSDRDSLWRIPIVPGDSISLINMTSGKRNVNSFRTIMKDSLWTNHFDSISISRFYNNIRFFLDNDISHIWGDSSEVTIELFTNRKASYFLKKSRLIQDEEWRALGDGWYERK